MSAQSESLNASAPPAVDPARSARLLRLATNASVITAFVLIVGKLIAWLATGSVSLLASLIDSMLDGAASIINLLAVRYSLQPPDKDHRFGHGKAEPLAGMGQAAFIAGSAVFLVLQAIDRLLRPQPLQDLPYIHWLLPPSLFLLTGCTIGLQWKTILLACRGG